jgi:hypothetical protein
MMNVCVQHTVCVGAWCGYVQYTACAGAWCAYVQYTVCVGAWCGYVQYTVCVGAWCVLNSCYSLSLRSENNHKPQWIWKEEIVRNRGNLVLFGGQIKKGLKTPRAGK